MKDKKLLKDLGYLIFDTVCTLAICIMTVYIGHTLTFHNYFVDGSSMFPTLEGDIGVEDGSYYGTMDITKYALNRIQRFDIVSTYYSFSSDDFEQPYVRNSKPFEDAQLKIKRVIGLPGDTLDINNDEFSITTIVDGNPITYEFDSSNCPFQRNGDANNGNCIVNHVGHITLGEDEYFVMGDNWTYGGSYDCCSAKLSPTNRLAPLYKECIKSVIISVDGRCTTYKKYHCSNCGKEYEGYDDCPKCGFYNLNYEWDFKDRHPFDKKIEMRNLWQKYIGSLDI